MDEKESYEKRQYYEILGISKDASLSDIKKAYRALSLKYHPDKVRESGIDPEVAEAEFQKISEVCKLIDADPDSDPTPMTGGLYSLV